MTVAALVLGLVQSVTAQAPEDPWSKARERVEPGERGIFEVAGSPRQTGLLQSISAEGLTVMVAGQTSQVRREDVSRLWKDGDSNLNGFLIGAGAGRSWWVRTWPPPAAKAMPAEAIAAQAPFYSGLGGLIGLGVDALIHGKTLVYKRPAGVAIAPIVTPDRAGVQARLAW